MRCPASEAKMSKKRNSHMQQLSYLPTSEVSRCMMQRPENQPKTAATPPVRVPIVFDLTTRDRDIDELACLYLRWKFRFRPLSPGEFASRLQGVHPDEIQAGGRLKVVESVGQIGDGSPAGRRAVRPGQTAQIPVVVVSAWRAHTRAGLAGAVLGEDSTMATAVALGSGFRARHFGAIGEHGLGMGGRRSVGQHLLQTATVDRLRKSDRGRSIFTLDFA